MKIAVFGASGFVGQNIIERLMSSQYDVIASDLQNPGNPDVHFLRADLIDYQQVSNVIKGSDIVIHLAASALPFSLKNPKLNARINIEGSLNIMDAAREHGVEKIIFSSASSIVGAVKYNPVDENHPCMPKTPYGVAKYATEHYLRIYHDLFGLDYIIFRFFNLYGPWQYPNSGALIPSVFNKIKSKQPFDIFGTGLQTRDFIYVGDVVDFYMKSLKNPIKNEIINMGTGTATSIKEILAISRDILGEEPIIHNKAPRPGEIDNFVADVNKLKRIYESVPSTNLEEGLRLTFNWLEDQFALK